MKSQRENTPLSNGSIDDRIRYYGYNGDGSVQTRREGSLNGSGQFIQDTQYGPGNYLLVHAAGQQQAELKQGYQYVYNGATINSKQIVSLNGRGNYTAGGNTVSAQAGDTLRSVAKRVYGTDQLWYLLADANGLGDPDQVLFAGTQLVAPNTKVSSNDANTFKPYNPADAIGSTTPSLPYIPPPPKAGCSTLAMVIMVVVAIVVTIYTAGAAAGAMGSAATATTATVGTTVAGTTVTAGMAAGTLTTGFAATMSVGASALAGGFGMAAAVVGGAVGGLVGSIASQAIGSAMGATSFSWRAALVSGAVGGATAGFGAAAKAGQLGKLLADSQYLRAGATAVVGQATSYAASKAIGLEASFSWKSVAASAISAMATTKIGGVPTTEGGAGTGSFINDFGGQFLRGAIDGTTRRLMGMGRQDWGAITIDAFGNALGNALVQAIEYAGQDKSNLSALTGSASRQEAYQKIRSLGGTPSQAFEAANAGGEQGKNYLFSDLFRSRSAELGFGDVTDPEVARNLTADQKFLVSQVLKESFNDSHPVLGTVSVGAPGAIDQFGNAVEAFMGQSAAPMAQDYRPSGFEGLGEEGDYRLEAGRAMSWAIDSGQGAIDDVIQTIGPTAAKWTFVGTSVALGGPLKAGAGLLFDSVAGDVIENLKNDYLIKPLTGVFSKYVFNAQSDIEFQQVKTASSTSAGVGVNLLLTAVGAVSSYAAGKWVINKSDGYRASKADLRDQLEARRQREVDLNANSDNVLEPNSNHPVRLPERLVWARWNDYDKVKINGREYAQIGDRLYTEHAVNRMQPSGARYNGGHMEKGSGQFVYGRDPRTARDVGRSMSPNYVDEVIRTGNKTVDISVVNGVKVERAIYWSGTTQVVTEQNGKIVVTVNPYGGRK
ncbi:LysM peptidoglycan-binding domain-containing protein [Lysobacter capsici]|uniref:LysM peptidoglycan-binding domain-containing protein n=1 Tax=Lysobacter capsici TaxID=435897 RepID=UPI00398CEAC1